MLLSNAQAAWWAQSCKKLALDIYVSVHVYVRMTDSDIDYMPDISKRRLRLLCYQGYLNF